MKAVIRYRGCVHTQACPSCGWGPLLEYTPTVSEAHRLQVGAEPLSLEEYADHVVSTHRLSMVAGRTPLSILREISRRPQKDSWLRFLPTSRLATR